jgi:hypothetical protein
MLRALAAASLAVLLAAGALALSRDATSRSAGVTP